MNKVHFSQRSRRGQSEMVGFAVIMIIVVMLILGFLYYAISSDKGESITSEVSNAFIQSFLEYTTDCAKNYEPNYMPVRTVLKMCTEEKNCYGGESACDVLDESMSGIMNATWSVGPDWPMKGYLLNMTYRGEEIFGVIAGNITLNSRGATQSFDGGTEIQFVLYE